MAAFKSPPVASLWKAVCLYVLAVIAILTAAFTVTMISAVVSGAFWTPPVFNDGVVSRNFGEVSILGAVFITFAIPGALLAFPAAVFALRSGHAGWASALTVGAFVSAILLFYQVMFNMYGSVDLLPTLFLAIPVGMATGLIFLFVIDFLRQELSL